MKSYEEKRRQILDIATDLFQKRGFNNVSVVDICKACDITKPTFYKYIVSKESILSDIFARGAETILPNVARLKENGDLLPALWTGLTGVLVIAEQMGGDLLKSYMTIQLKHKEVADASYQVLRKPMVDIISQLQRENLILNQNDPEKIYLLTVYMNRGLLLLWSFQGGTFDLAETYRRSLIPILGIRNGNNLVLESEFDRNRVEQTEILKPVLG